MADEASRRKIQRPVLMAVLALAIGIAVPLVLLEVLFRFLPVNDGLMAEPVNADAPIFRFTANRTVTWSRGWDFALVNTVRVNNAGFVNDQDYDTADGRPLLAIVGDSYVEAAMVAYPETLHGRLAARIAPGHRVYSFAASGAPLSQYVVWAAEARNTYAADTLVVVIIGNDFDESLAVYKQGPGFHHYVPDAAGDLVLRRVDYNPNPLRELVRMSALARYLFFNLQVRERLDRLLAAAPPAAGTGAPGDQYAGNTSVSTEERRMRLSRQAVDAFLRDLVQVAHWPPTDVVFVVDGVRYPEQQAQTAGSYYALMRDYFIEAACRAGFSVIDMDQLFFAHHRRTGARFDFPADAHWNATAHALAADAVAASDALTDRNDEVTRGRGDP